MGYCLVAMSFLEIKSGPGESVLHMMYNRFFDGCNIFRQISVHKIVKFVCHTSIFFIGSRSDHGPLELSRFITFSKVVFRVE